MSTASKVVAQFAPHALPAYVAMLADPDGLLERHAINTPLRLAHFMTQVFHETGALTIAVEKGTFSRDALARMWDGGSWHRYFADRDACLAMADQCRIDRGEALFNLVYGGRMDNGEATTGDGWRFRGRGIIQTTGRGAYRRATDKWQVDFIGDPDLVTGSEHGLKPALTEWSDKHLNLAADNNDIKLVTKRINGGLVGLDARKAWFAKIWPFVTGSPAVEHGREWQVQEALNKAGYTQVTPDGVIGLHTREAILDYRVVHGLTNGPGITPDLLLSLGVA